MSNETHCESSTRWSTDDQSSWFNPFGSSAPTACIYDTPPMSDASSEGSEPTIKAEAEDSVNIMKCSKLENSNKSVKTEQNPRNILKGLEQNRKKEKRRKRKFFSFKNSSDECPKACICKLCKKYQARKSRTQGCYKSGISEPQPFLGNGGELIILDDGTIWKEVSYQYLYLYEYYPSVIVCLSTGKMILGSHAFQIIPVR